MDIWRVNQLSPHNWCFWIPIMTTTILWLSVGYHRHFIIWHIWPNHTAIWQHRMILLLRRSIIAGFPAGNIVVHTTTISSLIAITMIRCVCARLAIIDWNTTVLRLLIVATTISQRDTSNHFSRSVEISKSSCMWCHQRDFKRLKSIFMAISPEISSCVCPR